MKIEVAILSRRVLILSLMLTSSLSANEVPLETIRGMSQELNPQLISWRRDFHEHPELSNREFRTAEIVAAHLETLGMEVTTGIAHTGVVGILRGGKPGPVVLLRADMDGLPVEERGDLPFKSKARGEYNGQDVPVMHACGHDSHIAILMTAAEILADMREDLPGTIKFVFQPAEEGAPMGEEGGAELMIAEGVMQNPKVDAAFAFHVSAVLEAGHIGYVSGPFYASVDDFKITVHGKQSHGASPWMGVDSVVVAAQIINALQTIVSRNLEITQHPAIVTVGSIHGGVRSNIIPETVELVGTIRALDEDMRSQIHQRIKEIADGVATSMGASVDVQIPLSTSYPVTINDPALTNASIEVLRKVVGEDKLDLLKPITGAEDFSFFAREVPGFIIALGGKPPGKPISEVAAHHTPDFFIEESRLSLGVEALTAMAWSYLLANSPVSNPLQ